MISIPFSGSKRFCYKAVKEIAQNGGYSAVYEPFGGSCVLSVNLLNDGVVTRAVANDYDRFFDDYEEYLDLKDLVVTEGYRHGLCRTTSNNEGNMVILADGSRMPVKSRVLNKEQREWLKGFFAEHIPKKHWRYFSLGGNFMHSAVSSHKEIKLSDICLFSRCLKTNKQRAYLKALELITLENLDWRDFIAKHQSGINSDSLLILDPPYTGTEQGQYKGDFTEDETKGLIDTAAGLGCDILFFNHNPEKVKEWLNGFEFDLFMVGNVHATANRDRMDVMAYIHQTQRPEQIGFTGME